jgi:ureidoglycolate hydrolase
VVLVVQLPDLVVERVTVVEIGPVGLSLAETVTVRDGEQVRRLQVSRGICVSLMATDRSAPIATVSLLEAHPNSSEMDVYRPLLENEYLEISKHGGPADPSSLENTERYMSVQTVRLPDVEQLDELLEKFVPFGDVSAATDPTPSSRQMVTARNATTIRRMWLLLSSRRTGCAGHSALDRSVGELTIALGCLANVASERRAPLRPFYHRPTRCWTRH